MSPTRDDPWEVVNSGEGSSRRGGGGGDRPSERPSERRYDREGGGGGSGRHDSGRRYLGDESRPSHDDMSGRGGREPYDDRKRADQPDERDGSRRDRGSNGAYNKNKEDQYEREQGGGGGSSRADRYKREDDRYNKGDDRNTREDDKYNKGDDGYNRGEDRYNRGEDKYNRGEDRYNKGDDGYKGGDNGYKREDDRSKRGEDRHDEGNGNMEKRGNCFNGDIDQLFGKGGIFGQRDQGREGTFNYPGGSYGNRQIFSPPSSRSLHRMSATCPPGLALLSLFPVLRLLAIGCSASLQYSLGPSLSTYSQNSVFISLLEMLLAGRFITRLAYSPI
eukprot:GHVS01038902.1.p1 GENE.GHVS01038902.1~~GHVS01038902.1.p1  ORF type:complete len:333 (-),score=65.52 GHVS01038902.1:726-1724(-)